MSLSGMVESHCQPDVIKKILQHLEKRQGVQALVIWYFLHRPRGRCMRGFLLMRNLRRG